MTEEAPSPTPKYWAFISHSSQDRVLAEQLRSRLENFPVPRVFRGREVGRKKLGKRLRPIFRDRDEFSAAAALGPAIEGALSDSSCLIVICSPASAQSQWVDQEIQYFRKIGRGDAILALIVSGEPNASSSEDIDPSFECFPPSLRHPLEPLAADLRKSGDGKTKGFIKVVAGLLEVGFDELWDRYRRERRRRRIIVSTVAFCMAGLVSFFAIRAQQASEREKVQAERAQNLAEKWLPEGSTPTPLIRAIVDGDLKRAMAAARNGESLSAPFSAEEFTPLMVACLVGHEEVAAWLLEQGVSTEDTDRMGRLAAHHAARAGQVGVIRLLARHGVDVDPFGRGIMFDRPIDWAARDGLMPAVEALLDLGVPIEREVPSGHPFAMTAQKSALSKAKQDAMSEEDKQKFAASLPAHLRSLGAGIMGSSHLLTSPILPAVDGGQLEMVRYLVSRGGKLENAHPAGIEVLKTAAMRKGRDDIVEFIYRQTGTNASEMLTQSLGVQMASFSGSETDAVERVVSLLERGAKPSLHMLIGAYRFSKFSKDRERILNVFMDHGADIEELNERGTPPIFSAAAHPDLAWMIPLLGEAGADLEARDNYKRTALIIAADRGRHEAVVALIDAGADIHAEDKNGETALIAACEEGDLEMVKALVEAGSKVRYSHHQIRENGSRPYPEKLDAIKSSERRGHKDIVEYLRSKLEQ